MLHSALYLNLQVTLSVTQAPLLSQSLRPLVRLASSVPRRPPTPLAEPPRCTRACAQPSVGVAPLPPGPGFRRHASEFSPLRTLFNNAAPGDFRSS